MRRRTTERSKRWSARATLEERDSTDAQTDPERTLHGLDRTQLRPVQQGWAAAVIHVVEAHAADREYRSRKESLVVTMGGGWLPRKLVVTVEGARGRR